MHDYSSIKFYVHSHGIIYSFQLNFMFILKFTQTRTFEFIVFAGNVAVAGLKAVIYVKDKNTEIEYILFLGGT